MANNPPTVIGCLRGIAQNKAVSRARKLAAGDGVMLDRRPHNPYDPNAVAVLDRNSKMLGHMDAQSASILSPHIDRGVVYLATVTQSPIVARAGGYVGIKKDSIIIRCVPMPPLLKKKTQFTIAPMTAEDRRREWVPVKEFVDGDLQS